LFGNFLTAHEHHIRVTAQTQITKYISNYLTQWDKGEPRPSVIT